MEFLISEHRHILHPPLPPLIRLVLAFACPMTMFPTTCATCSGIEMGFGPPLRRCIVRERATVTLERIVLPKRTKQDVVTLAENYTNNMADPARLPLKDFFGYGTGLVFLFLGPSGTGKTMLAHALAHHLGKELLSLNAGILDNMSLSFDDAVKYIFREARLNNAIVFFDLLCVQHMDVQPTTAQSAAAMVDKSICQTRRRGHTHNDICGAPWPSKTQVNCSVAGFLAGPRRNQDEHARA